MARKVSFTVLMVLIAATAMFAQVTLEPYGVSPSQIKADTTGNPHYLGVLDRVYSGLLNVGVETKMVLKGSKDSTLVTPSWSVTSSPDGSTAMIGDITEVDTATQVATFIPDLEGTYVIEFADESGTATVTINAGTYVSAYSTPGCICHSDKVADWEETGHSHFLTNALDGVSPYRSGASCISCHTTGYD
jgi:hypothetical protein